MLIVRDLLIQAPRVGVYNFCCEPEIARHEEQVTRRVEETVYSLAKTIATVTVWNRELPGWKATPPMPGIQGFRPADYRYCVSTMEHCLFGDTAYIEGMGHDGWPDLVGVGSVCRRRLLGENGLMRVLDTLEGVLPAHVRLHLFGVKSEAVSKLKDRPRVASVDSMALEQRGQVGGISNQTTQGKSLFN